ncbi:TetR family transcriptional regulator [Glutamicibacter sp. ZJUTW]|uniref:TetR family transcriptional regulator n=1 Tax=Glutamicibacter sp. ZJUTW TaxID=1155384 RepID=UPI0011F0CA4E|nr:TetR family transcriptional regulator [Glutamicibacter sp. ZJUTW]QEP08674.1 TetR family transcriptional regulator [Glutamicibacter sp. ZJUTW]
MGSVVRDRVREKMKVELAEQAYAVFAERGVENVTVQQAAQAAGISRATFFRYFSSKEDAVVTALRSMTGHFADMARSMTSQPGESLLELLRRSFEPAVAFAEQDPVTMISRIELIRSTPALRASWQESLREQQAALAQALSPFCANQRLAETAALLGLSLYGHALDRWVGTAGSTLREILDEAFDFAAMIDDNWVVKH